MAAPTLAGAAWWASLPPHRVTYVGPGIDPDLLAVSLDPLPDDAPAVLRFRPSATGPLGDQVSVLLSELDRAATSLFPAWLPGADRLAGPQGRGVAAVRALAADLAAHGADFGPFLADLAERSLRRRPGGGSRFPSEVRATGLVRAIARAYDRPTAALLIDVPDGLSAADEQALVAAAEWLADHGRLSVWLAGAPLRAVDRVRTVSVTLPAHVADLPVDRVRKPAKPALLYPAISGVPHPNSAAERRLADALDRCAWATGRRWNYTYTRGPLSLPYRLDLYWPDEGLVIEVDGDEHRGRTKFEADRRRDAQLALDGLRVVRFTNDRIATELSTVLFEIENLLRQRRATKK
ncbi:hypothetical protein GCM10009681_48780 [Luedemannella helvata]|uniref:DUF559 domain-containing protein n=2 Tax=Luedemannella helvata TaxID=349315 RepID=A0ABP4X7W2_9ACTN